MNNHKNMKIMFFYMLVAISVSLITVVTYVKPIPQVMIPQSFFEPLDYEVVTIEEAKARTDYEFVVPTYLPKDLTLKKVMFNDGDIFLFYSVNDITSYNFPRPDITGTPLMTITIHKWVPPSQLGIEKLPMELQEKIDTKMSEYESFKKINGMKTYCREQRWTTQYPSMFGENVLLPSRIYFHTNDVAYGFTAYLPLEKLIEVVQSLQILNN